MSTQATTTDLRCGFCHTLAMTPAKSQQQVARELGMSQATVLRLEKSAMRKLRALPETRVLWEMMQNLSTPTENVISIHLR